MTPPMCGVRRRHGLFGVRDPHVPGSAGAIWMEDPDAQRQRRPLGWKDGCTASAGTKTMRPRPCCRSGLSVTPHRSTSGVGIDNIMACGAHFACIDRGERHRDGINDALLPGTHPRGHPHAYPPLPRRSCASRPRGVCDHSRACTTRHHPAGDYWCGRSRHARVEGRGSVQGGGRPRG